MGTEFFESPILNSPWEAPTQHWELGKNNQPTGAKIDGRRRVSFVSPIPAPKKGMRLLGLDKEAAELSTDAQQYALARVIQNVREQVGAWRALPESKWRVTPETKQLLRHWRHHEFPGFRPFFCQVEAVETAIWLTEVEPKRFRKHLDDANESANPGLSRLSLKLATGAGKTLVMAMLIAWQTINAVRHPRSPKFTSRFLVVTPGITIRDRLRVLQPNDPDSYYKTRELVPRDLQGDLGRARIVITNFHAFQLRETMKLAKGSRRLLQGRDGPEIRSQETEGAMLQRVLRGLGAVGKVMVLNDEAHHCYREKPPDENEEGKLTGDALKEAKSNREAARLWISGLEALGPRINRVIDLSATPFFLRGSGYAEGTLFPWTMSDFSLMDAIECGIVKLPRVPVADDTLGFDPKFRNLWDHIGKRMRMPKGSRRSGAAKKPDPRKLPPLFEAALESLYGHYEKTFALWEETKMETPPCFIVICNNTTTSKLVHEYIAGFQGEQGLVPGKCELFRNFDDHGDPIVPPRTLLIDSLQLESGAALDKSFREIAAPEIERFRAELRARGDHKAAEKLEDATLLREVMNTVGKKDRLGAQVRCVVSVSMLTEGWDANNVTHILGVRAFGTQLLCEQAVGRALRRPSYELNQETGLLPVEYADVFGIPFDFAAEPVPAKPQKPQRRTEVKAITPDRDACEIRFPRVAGYRVQLPEERLQANFNKDSTLTLTPELVGPTETRNEGIIGEGVDMNLVHTHKLRESTLLFHLARHLMEKQRKPHEAPKLHLFGEFKRVAREWLDNHLDCAGGTHPAQLMYRELADMACERIAQAIVIAMVEKDPIQAMLDPWSPSGSTRDVHFVTSKETTWRTEPGRCHVNYAVCDSEWEARFCQVAEGHPRVRAWVKNHGLGLEVPYRFKGEARTYIPDFILLVDDGRGKSDDDLLRLIVEIKGLRGEDAKHKKNTMDAYWIPGVNHLGDQGRWAFAELTEVHRFEADLDRAIQDKEHEAALLRRDG